MANSLSKHAATDRVGRRARHTSICGLCFLLMTALVGCEGSGGISLSKSETDEVPDVPVPAEDGPKLGAIANVSPVLERPDKEARIIGYLHAGAKVSRSVEPYSTKECPGGWYPVRPVGFVCSGVTATTDLDHPTMQAMAIQPNLAEPLPFTYARSTKASLLYEVDPSKERAVRSVGKLPGRSGAAIVGSWTAEDEEGKTLRLAMLTDGRFANAEHLEATDSSEFEGAEINAQTELPIAFVVKRGVRRWSIDGQKYQKLDKLDYHERLGLTGRYRTINGVRFWAVDDDTWVRHKDVTAVRQRSNPPAFVQADTKWIDISVIAGTAVAYEGKRPVFATLVSVGRDRLGDPENSDATALGEFPILFKHITLAKADVASFANQVDIYDLPWAMELSSGQLVHAAYWHDRFGIEHGPGNLQFSPKDARRLWHWATPEVPENWHGAVNLEGTSPTIVNIRK